MMYERELNEIERLFLETKMINDGLVPLTKVGIDVNRVLKTMSLEDQRKTRRKFRKKWRKLAKLNSAKKQLGKGSKHPTRAQKLMRKEAVKASVLKEHVAPMLAKVSQSLLNKKTEE